MDLDSIFGNCSREELSAFLTYYLPLAEPQEIGIPPINFKQVDDFIMKGPSHYVDPTCVSACDGLWEKNIYALASVNVNDDLYLVLDKLNTENTAIFRDKYKENPENYCLNFGNDKSLAIRIANYENEPDAEEQLEELVKDFKMQDIQRGFLTEKTFLMDICDCEKVEGLKEYKKQDVEVVFDVKKMNKTFKEYLKGTEYEDYYIPKEHRIYLNQFYYDAHQNYINNKVKVDA